VGPRDGHCEETNILRLSGLEPLFLGRPARSEVDIRTELYRLKFVNKSRNKSTEKREERRIKPKMKRRKTE
jgi:hypothetical protein